jgi:hypothetical protein
MEDRIFQAINQDGVLIAEVTVKAETSGAAVTYIFGDWYKPDDLELIAKQITDAATYLRN